MEVEVKSSESGINNYHKFFSNYYYIDREIKNTLFNIRTYDKYYIIIIFNYIILSDFDYLSQAPGSILKGFSYSTVWTLVERGNSARVRDKAYQLLLMGSTSIKINH
jgi:hypothetical protein